MSRSIGCRALNVCHAIQVLLPSGVLRVDCRPGTANFRVAESVVWKSSDRKTALIGVVPGFKGGKTAGVGELNEIATVAKAVKVVRVRNRAQISYAHHLAGAVPCQRSLNLK